MATAQNLAWFVIAWAVTGAAMSGVLYPPAFAALTRWYGPRRVSALTVLTLAGGLVGWWAGGLVSTVATARASAAEAR